VPIVTASPVEQQVSAVFGQATPPRYVILVTDENQTRIFKAREVSLSEMVAILEANGLMPNGVADLSGVSANPA